MLHDKVIDQWGVEIVSGVRPPGQRIGADEAAARFGVSRTVVREAVRVLESLGLIAVRRHVGITVTTPDRWNALDMRVVRWRLSGSAGQRQLADVQEMRIANEPLAAQLAACRSSAQDRRALADAAAAMADAARAGDPVRFAAHDARFHKSLLLAAGNPMLAGLAPLVGVAITAGDPGLAGPASCHPADLMAHAMTAAAVQAGAAAEARDIVQSLLSRPGNRSAIAADVADARRAA